MKVLLAASEATPFAKTGGLADVCGALPRELAAAGCEVAVIMPAYRQIQASGQYVETTPYEFHLPVGQHSVYGRLLQSRLPDSDVPVYFVDQPHYFDRPGMYGDEGVDYGDNCERFVFFCRAVVEAMQALGGGWDVLHANDWQCGLIPAYLKIEHEQTPGLSNVKTLFTIHNLAYQGQFWHWDMLLTGLDWKYFNWRQMEFYGKLNFLKTGLVFSDALTTVSPRYAEEIQTEEHGCGLEGVLRNRRRHLTGIVNGVDYENWDPTHDALIPHNFTVDSADEGKAACKRALQEELGLAAEGDKPLIGFVGRLVEQKGVDLIAATLGHDWACGGEMQWAVLGTGDPRYHGLLQELAERNPGRIAVKLAYSNELAHRIEAGADMFLMPSRYEPCGLNQLYSLRYGAVPIVRATGGLADTVTNADDAAIENGTATGFSFQEYSTYALADCIQRACDVFRNRPEVWKQIRAAGMRQDWSWGRSASTYIELYEQLAPSLPTPVMS